MAGQLDDVVIVEAVRTPIGRRNGSLKDVKRRFAPNAVLVEGSGDFANLPGVASVQNHNGTRQLNLAEGVAPQSILHALAQRNDVTLDRFEVAMPSLDDIFVRVAGGERAADA